MKKEFNLSEKIVEWTNAWDDKESAIATRDVKEFIRRLKEELHKDCNCVEDVETLDWKIDKLVGEKLI